MIITLAIQKGGSGKSTTAAAIAGAAVKDGKRVLCIDLDPQGNFSFVMAAHMTPEGGNSYNLISGLSAEMLIQTTPQGPDIIPACWDLSTITSGKGKARLLRDALQPVRDKYDLIIIDTPPTAGILQYNALMAADKLIIPLQATIYDLQSLYQMTDTARLIQQSNPDLQIAGFLLTQYDGRSTIARTMKDTITERAQALGVPYLGAIRRAVCVQEAAALQLSLYDYTPRSKPAADYKALYEQLK